MSEVSEKWVPTDKQCLLFAKWALTPTVRDKWEAFWSIYRSLRRKCVYADGAISNAARKCFSGRELEWYNIMRRIDNGFGDRYDIPLFMRMLIWKKYHRMFRQRKDK